MQFADRAAGVEKRSDPPRRIVQLAGRGLINDSENRRPVHNQSNLNGELVAILDEFPRAVHRINHPNVSSLQSAEIVRFFFAQNTVIRKFTSDAAHDEFACFAVRRCHRISGSLPINRYAALVVIHQDVAGTQGEVFRNLEFSVHKSNLLHLFLHGNRDTRP